jgi:uncharacterized membrane protein YhaH (DUF805 family)
MTQPLQTGVFASSSTLAGLEFSPGEIVMFLALFFMVALAVLVYLAMFTFALVSSVQELHTAGRTRHPYLLALIPVLALLVAYETSGGLAGTMLAVAGLGFGYALMFLSGQGWFRWTAVPLLPFAVIALGTR